MCFHLDEKGLSPPNQEFSGLQEIMMLHSDTCAFTTGGLVLFSTPIPISFSLLFMSSPFYSKSPHLKDT